MMPFSSHRERALVAALLCALSSPMLSGCAELLTPDTRSLIAPRFTLAEVLGFVAGFGTTFAALPDIVAMLRKKSATGMNPRMCAIMGTFQILWIWYGLLIGSRPVVLWNCIAVLTNFICVAAYWYFARASTRNGRVASDAELDARDSSS